MIDSIDPKEITARGCRWVRSADGRIVEYSVTGSTREDARTLVAGYFAATHVNPSTLQAYEELNIRMIDVSLPGLGLSSMHPGRVIADWPKTDLVPILDAESVSSFWVSGTSYGTIHAMAAARFFGPDRIRGMGLRVPYFGLPLSTELGFPDGQIQFPTTEEIRANTVEVQKWCCAVNESMGLGDDLDDPALDYSEQVEIMRASASPDADAAVRRDYPEALGAMRGNRMKTSALLYMMARDVALDLPGLDPREIELSGNRVVVWYASDDRDCPPSHGEWLADYFCAKRRVIDGYGHLGGSVIDHPQFLSDLMGPP